MKKYRRKELEKIAEKIVRRVCRQYRVNELKIKVKHIQRGQCSTLSISVPLWSYTLYGMNYFTYYVIHEIVHNLVYNRLDTFKHTTAFRNLELEILKKYHLKIKYKKVYADFNVIRKGV